MHELEPFVVSPEPVSFTAHPRSEIALEEGPSIILHCAARIVSIGGFKKPLEKDTVPWRQYEICWEFMPAGHEYKDGVDFPEEHCHSTTGAANGRLTASNSPATEDVEVNSTLTIDAKLSNSGAYRCTVKDWQLKYTSYHGLVHIIPQGMCVKEHEAVCKVFVCNI